MPSHAAAKTWPAETAGLFVILKQNGIHHRVAALRSLNRIIQRLLAACINAVGKNDERFTAFLFLDYLVGGQINTVIEQSASSSPVLTSVSMPATAAISAVRSTTRTTARIGIRLSSTTTRTAELWSLKIIQSRLQF